MSKETILEEFDKISPEFGKWRMDRNMARAFLSQAIDQTREETLKEVEDGLPEECVFDKETDSEKSKTWISGFNNCLNQVKQLLTNLKK